MTDGLNGQATLAEQTQTPEELTEKRRLKDIFDARQELRETRTLAARARREGKLQLALSGYRATVANYVTEVEPLLWKYERGQELLRGTHFGHLRVAPKVTHTDRKHGADVVKVEGATDSYEVSEVPDGLGEVVEVVGLEALFELGNPVRRSFEIPVERRHKRDRTESVTVVSQLTFRMLDRMTREVNVLLGNIGLELEPDDAGDGEVTFDYSDLI
jgi:hypothetical protein